MKALRVAGTAVWGLIFSQLVMAGTNIGTAPGPWAKFVAILQEVVDFIDGPVGVAIVLLSWIAVWGAWAFAPRDGIVGGVLRVGACAIAIFSAGAFMTNFK